MTMLMALREYTIPLPSAEDDEELLRSDLRVSPVIFSSVL